MKSVFSTHSKCRIDHDSRCSEGLFGPRRCHRRNAGVHTRCASQLDSRTAEVHKDEAEVQSSVQALSQMQPIMQQGRKMTAVAQVQTHMKYCLSS